jgi:hypothetical protein
MATALLKPPMSDEKPKTLSVKLHFDVVESARIVSAYRDETITDMLSGLLRPVLAKMEQEEMSRRTQSMAKKKQSGK